MNKMFLLTFVCLLGLMLAQNNPSSEIIVLDPTFGTIPGSTETAPIIGTIPASTGGAPIETTPAPTEGAPTETAPAPTEGTPVEGTPAEGTPVEGSPTEGTPAEGTPAEGTPDVTQPTPEQTLLIPELTLEPWELENQEGALVGTINVEGLLIEEGALLQAGEGELAGNEALLLNQEGAFATEEVTLGVQIVPLDMNMGLVSEVAVSE